MFDFKKHTKTFFFFFLQEYNYNPYNILYTFNVTTNLVIFITRFNDADNI